MSTSNLSEETRLDHPGPTIRSSAQITEVQLTEGDSGSENFSPSGPKVCGRSRSIARSAVVAAVGQEHLSCESPIAPPSCAARIGLPHPGQPAKIGPFMSSLDFAKPIT